MASRLALGGSEASHLRAFTGIEDMSTSTAYNRWRNHLKGETAALPLPISAAGAGTAGDGLPLELLLLLQFDGGSRGNPGPAGSGSVVYQLITASATSFPSSASSSLYRIGNALYKKRELWRSFTYLGDNVTNNVAEYTGLLGCVSSLKDLLSEIEVGAAVETRVKVRVEGDSQLVIRQLTGEYKVKNASLKQIYDQVKAHINDVLGLDSKKKKIFAVHFEYSHVPRELNGVADALSNEAMDLRRSHSDRSNSIILL